MSLVSDVATFVLIVAGVFFFFAGTVGLLRFPDLYTRIHSMTKADNVGLGLVSVGLALQAETVTAALQLLIIWLLVLLSSASGAHLLARRAFRRRGPAWPSA